MPNTIKFSDNPNEETAFVETDDGQRNRAVLTAAVDGEIEFPANPNSTKVSVTVDGVKRKAIAVATIAGGGDAHNKGYFATLAELQTAYPTAEAGDWAIVGATDTVWIWDSDNSEWKDSDQKGQVTSVNGQTGDVTLTIPDAVQYSTIPTASADNLGDIVQFTGTTDANYTNGYFYKCVGTATEYTGDVAISASGGDLMVECDGDDFINFLMTEGSVADPTVVISGGMVYTAGTTTWTLTAYDNDNNTVCTISATQSDYESAGFTFYGTPADGNTCAFVSTITSTTTYAWTQIDVQPAGSSLPDQTGQSGKFLTTDGTDASWSDKPLVNAFTSGTGLWIQMAGTTNNINNSSTSINTVYSANYTQFDHIAIASFYRSNTKPGMWSLAIGGSATGSEAVAIKGIASGTRAIAMGCGNTQATGLFSIAIGDCRSNAQCAIQLGSTLVSGAKNNDANTFKVANENGNFEIMSADGTVPTARLTKVNTTATLAVADWSSNTQTVTVSGVKADSVVFVSPDPTSASDYASAGILCTAQAADSLTFTCTTTPSNAITVNVVCL